MLKIAWLCSYPLNKLSEDSYVLPVAYRKTLHHPSTWIITLSDELAKRNDVELHIVSEYANISRSCYIHKKGIHFHLMRSGSAIPFTLRGYPSFFPLDVVCSFSKNLRLLKKKLHEISPHLVHAHGTEGPYARAAVTSGYPNLTSIQGIMSELAQFNRSYRYRKLGIMERHVVGCGKNFIAKTRFAAEFVKEINPNARIYLIDNIIHPAFFSLHREPNLLRNYIVYVGAIIPEKGITELIEAFANFTRLHNGYNLILIGDGPAAYLRYLKQLSNEYQILDKIKWCGVKTHEEIASILNIARFLVLPSRMETSPNVVAESMVSGLPVIASRVGGIPDMIQHLHTGYLMDHISAKHICEAMQYLLIHPDLYDSISDNAFLVGRERFSAANANKIFELYCRIAIQPRASE